MSRQSSRKRSAASRTSSASCAGSFERTPHVSMPAPRAERCSLRARRPGLAPPPGRCPACSWARARPCRAPSSRRARPCRCRAWSSARQGRSSSRGRRKLPSYAAHGCRPRRRGAAGPRPCRARVPWRSTRRRCLARTRAGQSALWCSARRPRSPTRRACARSPPEPGSRATPKTPRPPCATGPRYRISFRRSRISPPQSAAATVRRGPCPQATAPFRPPASRSFSPRRVGMGPWESPSLGSVAWCVGGACGRSACRVQARRVRARLPWNMLVYRASYAGANVCRAVRVLNPAR